VIVFGHGGTAVEIVGRPRGGAAPLNTALARELVSRTRIARLLAGYRDRPAADLDAICRVLVAVSQMVIDLPELAELDINPLLVDEHGVIALNGRAAWPSRIARAARPGCDPALSARAGGDLRLGRRPDAAAADPPDDGERHLASWASSIQRTSACGCSAAGARSRRASWHA